MPVISGLFKNALGISTEVNVAVDADGKLLGVGGGSGTTSAASAVVSPGGFRSNPTIIRAANVTPYTANDVYGAVFELTNVGTDSGFIILTDVRMTFNISAVPVGMSGFVLYLYNATPPSAVADNGAFSIPAIDRSALITTAGIDLGSATLGLGGGTVVLDAPNINRQFKLITGSTSLFGYLVSRGAFTPAAASETASLIVLSLGV